MLGFLRAKGWTYRSAEASHSIPASSSWETRGVAAKATSDGDIGEGLVGLAVQPRVDEAKRFLASSDERVVDEPV